MKKNFVLDTNVLLHDGHSIHKFADNVVNIPITVIEELDKFKRDLSTVGRNAREVARALDKYRAAGSLSKGVKLESGGELRVISDLGKEMPVPFPTIEKTADGLILACALLLKKREDIPLVFVTRDINLRLRADAVGLNAVNYEEKDTVSIEEMYSGHKEIVFPAVKMQEFEKSGTLDAGDMKLLPNQFITLVEEGDPSRKSYGRYHAKEKQILPLLGYEENFRGVTARNLEQSMAIDLLLDDGIRVVTLSGKAGTGKTLLAIAIALYKTVDENRYSKMVVARPIMPLGKELGFLPGEMGEKLRPWMEPVFDNLELILGTGSRDDFDSRSKKGKNKKEPYGDAIKQLLDLGRLEVQPLTYIRGRSLPRQFLIIDEAQNLTLHEVKTIITRAGEGTKVVLTGDPYQIDSPFLDSRTSGLSIVVEKFKKEAIAGHVSLMKGERSDLAELASNLL